MNINVSESISLTESIFSRQFPYDYLKNAPLYFDIDGQFSVMIGLQRVSVWSIATRPSNVPIGAYGYNLERSMMERWDGSNWVDFEDFDGIIDGGTF